MLQRSAITVFTALVVIAFGGPAAAQVQRNFPQNALRGALIVGEAPEISLNGKPARLGPGARIRDQSNMLEMPAALTGARLLVNYTVDTLGLVKDVWILTPDEAAKRPWPRTPQQLADWSFDPIAQTWTRP